MLLEQPFFFGRDDWQPVTKWLPDWSPNIERFKTYDLGTSPASELWEEIRLRLAAKNTAVAQIGVLEAAARYGRPSLILARLGQGSFRVLVTDAYQRRSAMTGEKVLPVLEAAHIRPLSEHGEHRVDNGILLRSDAHTLFDRGYVTVTPDCRIEVSGRMKTDFGNGELCRGWHGRHIELPLNSGSRPSPEFLKWHNEQRFLAGP